jgi:hypothetical protein
MRDCVLRALAVVLATAERFTTALGARFIPEVVFAMPDCAVVRQLPEFHKLDTLRPRPNVVACNDTQYVVEGLSPIKVTINVGNIWYVRFEASPVKAHVELCLYKQTEYRYVQLLPSVTLSSAK